MGQRADEVAGRGRQPDSESEVYVARPGETRVVRADASQSVSSVDAEPLQHRQSEDEVEEIRAEMEQTRAEMSGTIDAIQERLNPNELKDQAKDIAKDVTEQVTEHVREALHDATAQAKTAVREATVGRAERLLNDASDTAWEVRDGVIDTIKENPIPAALVGLGLGWLLMNGSNRSSRARTYARQEGSAYRYYGAPEYPVYGGRGTNPTYAGRPAYPTYGTRATYPYTSTPTSAYGRQYTEEEEQGKLGRVGEKVGETAGQVQERAAGLVDDAGERAGEFVHQAGEVAGEVVDHAGEMLYHAGHSARDAGSGLMDTVRRNPVPAALAAIGLGWLFVNNGGSSSGRRYEYDYDYDADRYGYSRASARERGSFYAGQSGHYDDGHGNPAQQVAGRVGEAAGEIQDRASELASDAREQVGQIGHQAQYRMHRAQGQLERMVQDNPMAVGAMALAIGAAVGMMVPETRQEHELMGEARDRFVDRAQDMAQDAGEKVQQVVDKVSSTAQEEAQRAVNETGSTAQKTGQREGQTS